MGGSVQKLIKSVKLIIIIAVIFILSLSSSCRTADNAEVPPVPVQRETISFPVLMYHTSSEDEPYNPDGRFEPDLFVKPSEFEKQLIYLSGNGYTFCIFDDWYDLYDIEKPVFITFDDGYLENYTEIFPILKRHNAVITIFLVTDPDKYEVLTPEMIREMSDSGHVKFESHTLSHASLPSISQDGERLTRELRDSKIKIEHMTGKDVHAIAYPGGGYDETVIEKAREFYQFGVSTDWGMHSTDTDDFKIRRLAVGRYTTIEDFIDLLSSE
jgi:peptidoglycan/xylan/chitin deacetylase (PgdA/CDA1 family)